MSRDYSLPQTENELRDWLAQAWADGWKARKTMIGKPLGTIIHERPVLLDKFLQSWDLPPMPKPTPVDLKTAIQQIAEMAMDETKEKDDDEVEG